MKKKENDSILYIVKKTLRKNQRNFMAMSFLFVLIIGYFLWTLNGIQAQNTQVREAVYGLELSNRNSQLCVMQLCLAQNEESREKYSAQGDGYDMEIQEQVKRLRGLMPEESERLGRIQELLQSARENERSQIMGEIEYQIECYVENYNGVIKKLEKEDVSEDEIKKLSEEIQKQTDKRIKEIDQSVEVKSKEILTV